MVYLGKTVLSIAENIPMLNQFKTFSYYLGVNLIIRICILILIFIPNKIFDDLPDVLFVPIRAAALGYIPFILAASVALGITNNYERTRKILWRWRLTTASLICLFGLFQLIIFIYVGQPIFEFQEEVGVLSQPNHWLHHLPLGLSGLVAGIKVKKDYIEGF